jgi:putative transposase
MRELGKSRCMNTSRKHYPSDLTDAQWECLEPFLPATPRTGRPREVSLRDILDGYWYLLRAGCSWRMIPHDLPPWPTIYSQIRRWKQAGIWQKIHDTVREEVRIDEGRPTEPSAAALDSQSVKTADHAGIRGYDAGKKNRRSQTACVG